MTHVRHTFHRFSINLVGLDALGGMNANRLPVKLDQNLKLPQFFHERRA